MRLEDYQASAPAEVSSRQDGDRCTLIFVRHSHHSPERLWSALSDRDQLPKWAPFRPDRDLHRVGPVTLTMVDGSTPEALASEVLRVEPGQLLEYSWGADSVLCWALESSGTGSRLTLQHTVNKPEWIIPAAAGWHMCLDFAELMLDGHELGPVLAETAMEYGWQELAEHYSKVLASSNESE